MSRELMACMAATLLATSVASAQRKPLTVDPLTRIPHEVTAPGMRRDQSGKMVEYPVNGRIDFNSDGNFLISWNAYAGGRTQVVWEPPNKLSAIVEADVTFDPGTRMFTYSYRVVNQPKSVQKLRSVYIGAIDVIRGESPDSAAWYSRRFTPFLRTSLGTDGWAWSHVLEGRNGIPPSQNVNGLSLTSRMPPGIVKVFVAGQKQELRSIEEMPDELHAAINRVYFQLPAGVTIGPVGDASNSAQAELQNLVTMLEEAERQGWLGTAASARSVINSLARIRSALVESGSITANQRIDELLRSVRSQQFPGMLAEGRALLEFRLSRMRQ
jgi:hypothetical protein